MAFNLLKWFDPYAKIRILRQPWCHRELPAGCLRAKCGFEPLVGECYSLGLASGNRNMTVNCNRFGPEDIN